MATVGILSKEGGKGGGASDRSPSFYFICLFGYSKPVILWAFLNFQGQTCWDKILTFARLPLEFDFFGNQVKQAKQVNQVTR